MMRQSPKPYIQDQSEEFPAHPRYGDYALGYPMRLVAIRQHTKLRVGHNYPVLVVRDAG